MTRKLEGLANKYPVRALLRTRTFALATASPLSRLPTKQRAWRIIGKGLPSRALVLGSRTPLPKLKRGGVLVGVKVQVSPFFLVDRDTLGLPLSAGWHHQFHPQERGRSRAAAASLPLSLPQFKGKVKSIIDSVSSFDDAPIKL